MRPAELASQMAPRGLAALLAPPLCWSCGAGVHAGEPLCRRCRAALRWLPPEPVRLPGLEAWAPLAYEGPARDLVRALKFRSAEALAGTMAAAMAANAPPGLLAGALVPVPLAAGRRRRRGFNQAERVAVELARRTGLRVCDCLARAAGPQQVGRPRAERALVRGIRATARAPAVALLVDDVVTTGGTLAACAAALRAAGTSRAAAVAYARTLAR